MEKIMDHFNMEVTMHRLNEAHAHRPIEDFNRDCTICNKRGGKQCIQCRCASYCSAVCQETNWPVHKLLCKQISSIASKRPSGNHFLAILFPENANSPKLVWVGLNKLPEVQELLSGSGPHKSIGCLTIRHNSLRNFLSEDALTMHFRDNYLSDGSLPSQSVLHVTKNKTQHEWRGPIHFTKRNGVSEINDFSMDVNLADLRSAVDLFTTYGPSERVSDAPSGDYTIQGVKISCFGDRAVYGDKKFSEVTVPKDHPICKTGPTPISKRLGMPILASKLRHDPASKDATDLNRFEGNNLPWINEAATYLHMDCDPTSESFGFAPTPWQNSVGSVIIVRQDQKPLRPEHVEALCDFCQHNLSVKFQENSEIAGPRSQVLELITKKTFQEHFATYRKKKLEECEGREAWQKVSAPS